MNRELRVVMLGASGAVGGHAAHALARNPQTAQLTLLNRRTLSEDFGPRTQQHVVELESPPSYAPLLAAHSTAVCCLGVGQPSKVSRDEFVRVDKTTVLAFASACKQAGVHHFVLLTAVGANAASRSFYLRTKGELERDISALEFAHTSFFRPSMILTPTNRYGLSQAVLLAVWPLLTPLLQGPLAKYRGINVERLGRAMAVSAARSGTGIEILHWHDIMSLSTA